MIPSYKLPSLRKETTARWAWPLLGMGMLILFSYNWYRALKYGEGMWTAGHDLKHYGTLARNFLRGLGFRVDAIHVMQLSDAKHSLDSYVFAFIHPLIIAVLMKVLKDPSYMPVFYTTAIYMTLILPLAYLFLRRAVSPGLALWGAFLLAFCPSLLNLELLGLTESLMFVVLFILLISLFQIRAPLVSAFVSGLCLGILHLSRATGMILAPGFFFVTWRTRKMLGLVLFAIGFLLPTALGMWSSSRGDIKYAETYSPIKEIEHFGGPDLNVYMPERPSTLKGLWMYREFVFRKAMSYGTRMLKEINAWWGDWWVFAPAMLFLLWRKRSPWLVFFLLSYATSMASVLLFWYDYRVQIHLVGFHLFFALCYLKLLWRTIDRKSAIRAGLFFVGLALINRHLSPVAFLVMESLIAVILLLPVLGRSWSRAMKPMAGALAFGFCLMVQWQEVKLNWINFHEPERPGIKAYQQSMTHLRELGISQDSLIIARYQRDVTWFSDNRCLAIPWNLKETMAFLKRFPEEKYFLFTERPEEFFDAELRSLGLKEIAGGYPNLWIYGPRKVPRPSSSTS